MEERPRVRPGYRQEPELRKRRTSDAIGGQDGIHGCRYYIGAPPRNAVPGNPLLSFIRKLFALVFVALLALVGYAVWYALQPIQVASYPAEFRILPGSA